MSLETATRTMENLHRAWAVVRRNVLASGHESYKSEVRRIAENPLPYLRRIQGQLQRRKFVFGPQRAVIQQKRRGKKRPIVVAPIENRIVQRALLNVLQTTDPRNVERLGRIPNLLRTPTSVGGVPERGVQHAIGLIRAAMAAGATHYLRSDIQAFFTKIPKGRVVQVVRDETHEDAFADLFAAALDVEFHNASEIGGDLALFPSDEVGVPQGSSLSAFAGNLVLEAFDHRLNGRGVTTIRYIDDFLVLGPSGKSVRSTFEEGRRILSELGMAAYAPEERGDKASAGRIADGLVFLGTEIKADRIGPSRKAMQSFLEEIRRTFSLGLSSMHQLADLSAVRRAEDGYAQVLSAVDRKIRGWGDAFAFSDNRQRFLQTDAEIDALLKQFVMGAKGLLNSTSNDAKRRTLGVALLKETPSHAERRSQDGKPLISGRSRRAISTVILPPPDTFCPPGRVLTRRRRLIQRSSPS